MVGFGGRGSNVSHGELFVVWECLRYTVHGIHSGKQGYGNKCLVLV